MKNIKNVEYTDSTKLISFDVVSLYTNVPVVPVLRRIKEILYDSHIADEVANEFLRPFEGGFYHRGLNFNQGLTLESANQMA